MRGEDREEQAVAAWKRALAGDEVATVSLVRALTPIVQVRVARSLLRRRGPGARDVRQEVEDLAQEVFCLLFAHDARVLRTWDPARGLTLQNYVGLIAERETTHILKSGKQSPWSHDPTSAEDLDRVGGVSDSTFAVASSRELFRAVWDHLRVELTPKGHELFQMILVQELGVDEVCARASLQPDAVYAWRSRLLKRTRALAATLGVDLLSENADAPPIPETRARARPASSSARLANSASSVNSAETRASKPHEPTR